MITDTDHDGTSDDTDPDELWQQVTRSVSRTRSFRFHDSQTLNPAPRRSAPPQRNSMKKSAQPSPKTRSVTPDIPAPVADLRLGQRAGIDRQSARRLHQGRFDIDARLDLHGMTQHEAQARLNEFILSASRQGLRHLLVITGKGRTGTGILKSNVPVWLKSAPLAGCINAIETAQPRDGGTGALYIKLRRHRQDI